MPDRDELRSRGLVPITPGAGKAFLVESFNRILISRIQFGEDAGPPFRRGIEIFEEKPDLLPFEEAKLHGHNATHALGAYLAGVRGMERMCEITSDTGLMAYIRAAFLEESGATLIRRHAGVDPLFTLEGYRAYAEDLLVRMFNPHLGDLVVRVGRDPQRKLEWDDRLVGTVRLALANGVTPKRYAVGAAAALAAIDPSILRDDCLPLSTLLGPLWAGANPDGEEARAVLYLIENGRAVLQRWVKEGFPNLETFAACW